jgi:predicted ATPase
LADVALVEYLQSDIRRLEELRLLALIDRIDADLALGAGAELIGELEELVASEPLQERLRGQLMLALYRSGRQADALEVYQRTRAHLAEQLGLEPGPSLKTLQRQILEHDSALQPAVRGAQEEPTGPADVHAADERPRPERRAASLPLAPTPTIGRAQEVEAVCALLEGGEARLVTLTGPGGVGKTRLALTVAHAIGSAFSDGVGWVELAGVARPEDVGSTIVRALAITPAPGESASDTLRRYLAGKRLLLTIDNFEHLLDSAVLVGELHSACPRLVILATSREPLNLAAEHRFAVEPLPVPASSDAATLAAIESIAGTALFLAAARRQNRRFEITADSAPVVARICARLDGLPLALELAAARTGMLSVQQLATRLDEALTNLGVGPRDAPTRHRTLDATIDWSYRLLDAEERTAFVRFAVFAGGAALDAAQVVTGASLETFDALTAKSLIDRREQADGTTRLVMLETVRRYAFRRHSDDPEHEAVCRRHLEHYLELVEQHVPRLSTHDVRQALELLNREIDNIHAALQWALEAAPASALRLAGQLGDYWHNRFDHGGLRWLEAALQAAGESAPTEDRAQAQLQHAVQLFWHHDFDAHIKGARAALALFREVNDHAGMSKALHELAIAASWVTGNTDEERRYAEMSVRHARIAGDDDILGRALGWLAARSGDKRQAILEEAADLLVPLGNYRAIASVYSAAAYVALTEDRLAEAASLLDTALQAASRTDAPYLTVTITANRAHASLLAGNLSAARDEYERTLRLGVQYASRWDDGEMLAGLASVAAGEGRYEPAARLRGAARSAGYPATASDRLFDDRLERDYFDRARAAYGPEAWRRGEQTGAALSLEEAIAYALAESPHLASPDTPTQDETDARAPAVAGSARSRDGHRLRRARPARGSD